MTDEIINKGIEPKRLMVGDWVCLKDDVQYESPMKVDGILVHNISLEGEGFLGDADEIISPIPLTAEIMENNGFNRYYDSHFYSLLNGFTVAIADEPYITSAFNVDITVYYVHELQHALRLCGFDELADNFKV